MCLLYAVCVCLCVCLYEKSVRERERERERVVCLCVCLGSALSKYTPYTAHIHFHYVPWPVIP